MKPFWIVLSHTAPMTPYRHNTRDAAITEARRLATANPGKAFAVLQSIGEAAIPLVPDIYQPHEEIPF